ncbi:MAG: hypothetical protein JRI95_10570 [Deltaproteobacteria bacterium]|nr:hypothetical protein [Deltaproteobacteria bacterium]
MVVPVWLWVFTTMLALFISIAALAVCLSYRRRIESIIEDASSVADLTSKKIRLDAEIDQCVKALDKRREEIRELESEGKQIDAEIEQRRKSLDENREELRKLESERQQQESLRQELARLADQVAQEKQKVNEYRKEAEDLQRTISDLKQEYDRLNSEKDELEIVRNMEKVQLMSEDDARSVVKLRVVKRHML